MLSVVITITGVEEEIKKLQAFKGDLKDFKSAMKDIGKTAVDYFAGEAWESQGGNFNKPWARLSPQYARYKTKRLGAAGGGRGILEASGAMRRSFTSQPAKDYVIVSNTDKKFKYHQSTAPRKHTITTLDIGGTTKQNKSLLGKKSTSGTVTKVRGGRITLSSGGLPRRQMMGVNKEVKSFVQRIISADINRKVSQF